MSELRIRVVAVADRSLSVAYRPLIDAAERARRQLSSIGEGTTRQVGRDAGAHVRAFEKAERAKLTAAERLAAQQARIRERSATMAGQFAAQQAREVIRAREQEVRATERSADRMARAYERSAAAGMRAQERMLKQAAREERAKERATAKDAHMFGSRFASMGVRLAGAGAGLAVGAASTMAKAAGVDLDPGSIAAKNTALEAHAANLSNQGYMAGDTRNGSRVDPRLLMEQAFKVGTSTGTDANVVLEGLDKFVTKTGDLQSGRDALAEMARLSKATGASLADMMDGAGDVANALGDVANKGQVIKDVMMVMAGQGKLGAVEIKNLATQMAKVGAAASQFTGDRAGNLADMGALAQMTRAKGGAASATQAATSLQSFTNVFSKGARLDAFKAKGIEVYGADGKIRNAKDLIVDSLRATGGDNREMGKLFADVRARSVTRGFETTYKDAGAGEAGIKAVIEEFDRLRDAAISEREVAESFSRTMMTSQSQAEVFNQQIRQSALQIQEQLTPAIAQLAPAAVEAAKTLAGIVTWVTGDQQMSRTKELAAKDVTTAVESTEKQLKGGKISEAQIEQNKVAEMEAREAWRRSKAEYDVHKDEGPTDRERSWAKTFDMYLGGDMGANWIAKKEAPQKEREATIAQTERILQMIHDTNKKTNDLLANGLVVKIPPGAGGPPVDASDAGRTPPPGTPRPRR